MMPRLFPCGCSREKVRLGLCDLFDEAGNERAGAHERVRLAGAVALTFLHARAVGLRTEPHHEPARARVAPALEAGTVVDVDELGRAARCLCGGIILADSEEWRTPVCPTCWEGMGCPAFEPRAPLRRVVSWQSVPVPAVPLRPSTVHLSCGHRIDGLDASPVAPSGLGSSWPCAACLASEDL